MSLRPESARLERSRSRSRSRRRDSASDEERSKRNSRSSSGSLPYPPTYADAGAASKYLSPPSPPGSDYYSSHHGLDSSSNVYVMSGGSGPGPTTTSSSITDSIAQILPAKYSAQLTRHGNSSTADGRARRREKDRKKKKEQLEEDLAYGNYAATGQEVVPARVDDDDHDSGGGDHQPIITPGYAQYKPYEYANHPQLITRTGDASGAGPPLVPRYGTYLGPENGYGYSESNREENRHGRQSSSNRDDRFSYDSSQIPMEALDPRHSHHSVVTVEPGRSKVKRERSYERRRRRESSPRRRPATGLVSAPQA